MVSREEDEKNRSRLKKKTKREKLKRFAKKKLKKFGKGDKKQEEKDSNDEFGSSDDEAKKYGPRGAPFMKQYEDKKHLEHILDEQHYWSDPEADKNNLNINDVSIFSPKRGH